MRNGGGAGRGRRGVYTLVLGIVLGIVPDVALAQQVELLSPKAVQSFAEAPDFASSELNNSWDFEQRRDIGFEVGFEGASVRSTGGVWHGRVGAIGAYVFPLFGGYSGSLFAEGPAGERELPRFGARHPIDASRYYYLSMHSRHSAPSSLALYWNSNPKKDLFPDGSERGAHYDGYYYSGAQTTRGFAVRSYDMRGGSFEQQFGSWSGKLAALRLDPSIAAAAGSEFSIDWIRLVDPESAPKIDIRWQLYDIPSYSLVSVYLDTDTAGYDGSPIARFIHGGGRNDYPPLPTSNPHLQENRNSLHYPSAALPPGQYYFYVTVEHASYGEQPQLIARSGYSAAVIVHTAPSGHFTAPSTQSGAEYAGTELGNPWDMSGMEDLLNAIPGSFPQALRQFSNAAFNGGLFQATADPPLPGNSESDSQLRLNIPSNKPVDTQRYRYLSYRIGADPSLYPSIEDKVRHGWVTRPIFWDGDLFAKGGSFKAHVLYEGMHTYTIDLWDSSQVETGLPWQHIDRVTAMRLDPLETTLPTWFFVDWIALRAENEPSNGHYQFRFVLEDSDSAHLSYDLYLATDVHGANAQLVHRASGVRPGAQQLRIGTDGLPPGRYYPFLLVSDGAHSRRITSSVPLVVGKVLQESGLARRFDYDGDGTSDPTVYRPGAAGTFYIQQSSSSTLARSWGLAGYEPIEGDFDGDRKSDIAVVAPLNGMLHWFVIRSSDGGLYYRMWGYSGDTIALADYDGDAKDEIAVYRNGFWFILDESGAPSVQLWGEAGDIPVPADYDGDGVADAAIWRPRDGTWWIVSSAHPNGGFPQPYIVQQWGLPGDVPQIADVDGDSKTDFLVWRPHNGTWYLRMSSSGATEAWQWGLPGDRAVAGNFLSATEISFSVWRASTGQWFHLSRSGELSIQQWGLPIDRLAKRLGEPIR